MIETTDDAVASTGRVTNTALLRIRHSLEVVETTFLLLLARRWIAQRESQTSESLKATDNSALTNTLGSQSAPPTDFFGGVLPMSPETTDPATSGSQCVQDWYCRTVLPAIIENGGGPSGSSELTTLDLELISCIDQRLRVGVAVARAKLADEVLGEQLRKLAAEKKTEQVLLTLTDTAVEALVEKRVAAKAEKMLDLLLLTYTAEQPLLTKPLKQMFRDVPMWFRSFLIPETKRIQVEFIMTHYTEKQNPTMYSTIYVK